MKRNDNSYSVQKEKRLAFAQQIRRKSRFEKMSQIRQDYSIRQNIQQLLKSQQVDSHKLYTQMKKSKIHESNTSYVIAEWLSSKKQVLQIKTKIENLHWGYILSTVIEYRKQLGFIIINSYFQIIVNFSMLVLDFQVPATVMSTVIQLYYHSQEIVGFQDIINNLVKLSLDKLPLYNLGVEQLKFYLYCFKENTKIVEEVSQNNHFLQKLSTVLGGNLQRIELIRNALRILIVISFYDEQNSLNIKGVSQKLFHLNILQSLKFFLNFLNPIINTGIIRNTLIALGNISSNLGIQIMFQHCFLDQILQLFHDTQNPNEVRAEACILYMNTIAKIEPDSSQLKNIRRNNLEYEETTQSDDVVSNILHAVELFGEYYKEVLIAAESALSNLLFIGEQEKNFHNLSVNPYTLRLTYETNRHLLTRYEQFNSMLARYQIE